MRADLIRRCRALITAFTSLQARDGADKHVIGLQWAKQWLAVMLDTRRPCHEYADFIRQQEERVVRLIRKSREASRAFDEAAS